MSAFLLNTSADLHKLSTIIRRCNIISRQW